MPALALFLFLNLRMLFLWKHRSLTIALGWIALYCTSGQVTTAAIASSIFRNSSAFPRYHDRRGRELVGLRKEGGLDTNAALRATENLETAPPSELIARIQALLLL